MYTKAKRTISHVTPQRPMTQEEQKQRIMQILAQKREAFSINILSAVAYGAILICALMQKRIRHYQEACKNYKKNDI